MRAAQKAVHDASLHGFVVGRAEACDQFAIEPNCFVRTTEVQQALGLVHVRDRRVLGDERV